VGFDVLPKRKLGIKENPKSAFLKIAPRNFFSCEMSFAAANLVGEFEFSAESFAEAKYYSP
jgi:hypothetical protein